MRLLLLIMLGLLSALVVADESAQSTRLSELLSEARDTGFERADKPRKFLFPEDHGPHEEFRNEWWYITGNLDDDDGRRFGFELTIFRFALSSERPQADSDWRTNQVFVAHLAVADVERNRFYVVERFSRGALGLAGASAEPFRVWIDDWEMAAEGPEQAWRVRAVDDEISLDLLLTPLRPPVLNGSEGLSRKSSSTDSASYYYSVTRLQTDGSLSVADESYSVSGLSWLDREWSTSALAANQVGWDWFALQLSDGTDLMLYNIRNTDGSADPSSSGTLSLPDGRSIALRQRDFELLVHDSWTSPEGGTYPSRWSVRIPEHDLQLDIVPVIADQELFTTVRYWEGAVDVTGKSAGTAVSGRGYVELTGYAD